MKSSLEMLSAVPQLAFTASQTSHFTWLGKHRCSNTIYTDWLTVVLAQVPLSTFKWASSPLPMQENIQCGPNEINEVITYFLTYKKLGSILLWSTTSYWWVVLLLTNKMKYVHQNIFLYTNYQLKPLDSKWIVNTT